MFATNSAGTVGPPYVKYELPPLTHRAHKFEMYFSSECKT